MADRIMKEKPERGILMEQIRCYGCMRLISEPVCPHCGHPAQGTNVPHQLAVGTVLKGRYLVGRAISQTENAIEYVALDQRQDKTVTICEYFPGRVARRENNRVVAGGSEEAFAGGLASQSRYFSTLTAVPELARASGALEAFAQNGTVYLIQDMVRGPGLEQYISRRGGRLDPREALRIFWNLVGALAILHHSGFAHGNIGAGQIVLDPMGGARLQGFGKTAGADPAADVLAISRMLCGSIAPGVAPEAIPGLTPQQQMALKMGSSPNAAERFNSAVALRRALFGEPTAPTGPIPPLEKVEREAVPVKAPQVQESAYEEIATVVLEDSTTVLDSDDGGTEVLAGPLSAAPQMPKTEAINSTILSKEPVRPVPVPLAAPANPAPAAPVKPAPAAPAMSTPAKKQSSLPATEIISEFKVYQSQDRKPEAPQPTPPAEPVTKPAAPMPRTERAPSGIPGTPRTEPDPSVSGPRPEQAPAGVPPYQPQQPQPQWQAPPPKKKSGLVIGVVVGLVVALIAALVCCYLFVHIWKDATCEDPKTCAICGKTEGSPLKHQWEAATCEEPETCEECGETRDSALGHDWIAGTCETPRYCAVCGATDGVVSGHTWIDATCTEPKQCSTCGKTEGSALGHNWKEATTTEPKTCTRCGLTDGQPKGYLENMDGEFQYFEWGDAYTHCYVFDTAVKGCRGFTLFYEPTFNYNAWVSDWKLLYQDTSGTWHEYGTFVLDTSDYEHVFTFSPTINVRAIAIIPRVPGSYSYTFSLGVWDLYYNN